jgi:hypothetical protein
MIGNRQLQAIMALISITDYRSPTSSRLLLA